MVFRTSEQSVKFLKGNPKRKESKIKKEIHKETYNPGNTVRHHRFNTDYLMRKLKDLTVKQFTKIFWISAFGSVIATFIYHLLFI